MTQQMTTPSDPFTSSVTQLAKTASKQRKIVFVSTGLVVAFLVAFTVYKGKKDSREQASKASYFQAQQMLESELTVVAKEILPKPPAPKVAKGEKAPPEAPIDVRALEMTTFPVQQRLSKSIPMLEATAQNFEGTVSGFNAKMALGNLFLRNGSSIEDYTTAARWFEKASASAPKTEFTVAALYSLGYAREAMGKCTDAIQSFDKALNYGDSLQQVDLLKAKARCFETLGDTVQAKAAYEKIVAIAPQSEAARYAQNKIARATK